MSSTDNSRSRDSALPATEFASNGRESLAEYQADLGRAYSLAAMGVPIFSCKLDEYGNPSRAYGWEKSGSYDRSYDAIGRWRPGMGLGAVCGSVFDVLDVDPRNGGKESWSKLLEALKDDSPFLFGIVATPSHGGHFWIPAQGVRKGKLLPGIDHQAGDGNGEGRGIAFIPPTSRPSKHERDKGTLRPYTWTSPVPWYSTPWVLRPSGSLLALAASGHGSASLDGGETAGRQEPDTLKRAVLAAESGEQRRAILRLVHEYERRGYLRDAIREILRTFLATVPAFEADDPWYPARGRNPDKWINGLFHKPGEVVPDGTAEELEGINDGPRKRRFVKRRSGLVKPISKVPSRKTEWLWPGYIARREMTILDGEKGVAKSLVITDASARFTTGRPMPGAAGTGEILRVIVFTIEATPDNELRPRFVEAGGDIDRLFIPDLEAIGEELEREALRRKLEGRTGTRKRNGERKPDPTFSLPSAAPLFGRMIRDAGADAALFDPINDFLDEDVNTNNDASIRRALGPLGEVLRRENCAGLLLRHMNKNTGAEAKFRGTGTTAYQNRARIHLIAARIQEDLRPDSGAEYALAIADSNLRRVRKEVLTYDVVNSDTPSSDEDGDFVPKIVWRETAGIDLDAITQRKEQRGPDPYARRELEEFLQALFEDKDTWESKVIEAKLAEAGIKANNSQKAKAKDALGIRSEKEKGENGKWIWTTAKIQPKRAG